MKKNLRNGRNKLFWLIKNSTEIISKLKAKGFQTSTISIYDFNAFIFTYVTARFDKKQLVDLIENTFRCEEVLYLAVMEMVKKYAKIRN